ncbi:hypothetical protein ABZ345_44955 [Lentzea sp. NPDC005914]|uniref:hypothetical protein n=1 Tax=Lentzea sp. NPDC005914 TaxID=3154572 RepID=UPI0033CBB09B
MTASDQLSDAPQQPRRFTGTVLAHVRTCRLDTACYFGMVGLSGALLASDDRVVWRLALAWFVPALASIAAHRADALVNGGKAWWALTVLARGVATIAAFCAGTLITAGVPLWDLMILSLLFWQQDGMAHLVGAVRDVDRDRRLGHLTFPVRFGDTAARWLMVVMLVCWFASAAFQPASILSRPFALPGYLFFLVVAGVLATVATVMLFQQRTRVYDVLMFERPVLATAAFAASGHTALGLVLLAVTAAAVVITRE